MTSPQDLKDQLSRFARSLLYATELSQSRSASKHSTLTRLCSLATALELSSYGHEELSFFSKKYDTSIKLFSYYDEKGGKVGDEELDQAGLQLFAGLLYLRVLFAIDQAVANIDLVKYINVCFKAFDDIDLPGFLKKERNHLNEIQDTLFARLPVKSLHDKAISSCEIKVLEPNNTDAFTTLPIDVLFYEGPIARAYLEMLSAIKCKPRRIIHLIAERDIVTKKTVGKFLPRFMRQKYAAAVQSRKIHYWPQQLFRTQQHLCLELFDHLQETLKIEHSTLMGLLNFKPLDQYADCVIPLPFTSLKDSRLLEFIKAHDSSMYLFTGGGIMPRRFFDIKNTGFLHIHPGHLPDIRGADCLLWSTMLAGHPSATCFFMNPGIDTGDIINAVFLPKITIPDAASQLDNKMIYRLLYSFVDPWIRSVVLRDTIRCTDFLETINALPQSIDTGTTFHFMHQNIIKEVIKKSLMNNN